MTVTHILSFIKMQAFEKRSLYIIKGMSQGD